MIKKKKFNERLLEALEKGPSDEPRDLPISWGKTVTVWDFLHTVDYTADGEE